MLADVKAQAPQATCVLVSTNVQRNVMINREQCRSTNPNCAGRWR